MNLSGKHHRISQQECVGQKIREQTESPVEGVELVVSWLTHKNKRMAQKPQKTTVEKRY